MVYRVNGPARFTHDFAKFTHPSRANRVAALPGQNLIFFPIVRQFRKILLDRFAFHFLPFHRIFGRVGYLDQLNRFRLQAGQHFEPRMIDIIRVG